MRRQGRLGDKAHVPFDSHGCPACTHAATGPAVSGSPDVRVNRKPALRVDDKGVHAPCCGANLWTAAQGSATVFVNGRPAHRVGDATKHCGGRGKLIEGSDNVYVGGGLYQQQLIPSPCSALSNQYFYGTDTNSKDDDIRCYTDFYIGKIGGGISAIPGVSDELPEDWFDALSDDWRDEFEAIREEAGFGDGVGLPEFITDSDAFYSPLAEPERNFAYWTITGWKGQNPATNAPKWGRYQALLAVKMARGGPFREQIGGRCLFADIERNPPPPPSEDSAPTPTPAPTSTPTPTNASTDLAWDLANQTANQATVAAFLRTVQSQRFTPGIYTSVSEWGPILGADYDPDVECVLFTAEWIHNNTVDIVEAGAAPPTPDELDSVFGDSPRDEHDYAGQQTRIWQFSSQGGLTDWDITPYDPLTNFTERRVNQRKTPLSGR